MFRSQEEYSIIKNRRDGELRPHPIRSQKIKYCERLVLVVGILHRLEVVVIVVLVLLIVVVVRIRHGLEAILLLLCFGLLLVLLFAAQKEGAPSFCFYGTYAHPVIVCRLHNQYPPNAAGKIR